MTKVRAQSFTMKAARGIQHGRMKDSQEIYGGKQKMKEEGFENATVTEQEPVYLGFGNMGIQSGTLKMKIWKVRGQRSGGNISSFFLLILMFLMCRHWF